MKKLMRFLLLFGCVLTFVCLAPLTVFYAQGYRLDRENNRFIETGTIFLRSYPKEAQVLIDNEPFDQNKSPFKIDGLEPGEYNIQIKKQGYSTWSKTLAVLPTLVTKAENIFLLPHQIKQTQISLEKNMTSVFAPSPNQKLIAFADEADVLLLNLNDKNQQVLDQTRTFTNLSKEKIEQIIWSEDSKKLLLKGLHNWQVLDIEKSKFFSQKISIQKPSWLYSREIIYLNQKNILYKLNFESGSKPVKMLDQPILAYSLKDNILYYIAKADSRLYSLDIITNKIELVSKTEFNPENPDLYKILVLDKDKIFVLTSDRLLYLIDQEKANVLSQNITDFDISPDKRKVVFFNDSQAYVYFLENMLDRDPQKQAGSFNLTAYYNTPILKQVLWHESSEHLIMNLGDKIQFIELDERDRQNSFDFLEGENIREIVVLDKKIYYLDQGVLYEAVLENED